MRINLTTPMSDDKERQRRTKAEIDAIERYTEERMNDEYGRIHTDGSRSGGQPLLLPCPFCGGEAEVERSGTNRRSHIIACTDCGCRLETGETWNAGSAWNTRQPTQSDALIKAGDNLSFRAQISGGTAGRDSGLVAAIDAWALERDRYRAALQEQANG